MEFIYGFSTLAKLCIIKMVCQLVEAAGSKPGIIKKEKRERIGKLCSSSSLSDEYMMAGEFIIKEARKRLRRLTMPKRMQRLAKNIIGPIAREFLVLHYLFDFCILPIWTPQGTVDRIRTTKAFVKDDTKKILHRYVVACAFCYEKHILKLGSFLDLEYLVYYGQGPVLSFDECLMISSQSLLFKFWSVAYRKRFSGIHDTALTQDEYNRGFDVALHGCNEFAVRYFIKKASPIAIRSSFEAFNLKRNHLHYSDQLACRFSATTICILYSKMGDVPGGNRMSRYSYLLLNALLRWPNQVFIREYACKLIDHLTIKSYWQLVHRIAKCARHNRREYDYLSVITSFLELGRRQRLDVDTDNFDYVCAMENIFASKYLLNVNLALREISAEQKEALLLKDPRNKISNYLCLKKDYVALELYIRGCWMQREDLLIKYKNKIVAYFSKTLKYRGPVSMEDSLRRLSEILDRIVAEERAANTMLP